MNATAAGLESRQAESGTSRTPHFAERLVFSLTINESVFFNALNIRTRIAKLVLRIEKFRPFTVIPGNGIEWITPPAMKSAAFLNDH